VGKKGPAPSCLTFGNATGNHRWWKSAHRTTTPVNQADLAGESLTTLSDSHEVTGALSQSIAGHQRHLSFVPVNVEEVLLETTGDCTGIEFSLNHDVTTDNVQAASETQEGRDFRFPTARLGNLDSC
jgi:hypothetical protein